MRRGSGAAIVLTTALCLGLAGTGFAARGGAGHPWGAPPPAPPEAAPPPAWHGGFHGHPAVREWVFVGPSGWWVEPWWWEPWWAEPNYFDYSYGTPLVLVQEAPPVYLQQEPPAPQGAYWYYCPNPPGYYPYIRDCPAGWMTVVPPGAGPPGMQATRPSVFPYEGPLVSLILAHAPELGLTPEQLQTLQALRTTFEKEAVARATAIRAAEADLKALLEKDQWDLPAIEAKLKQLASLQGDQRIERIKTLAAGRALLTPEQMQKLQAIAGWTPPAAGPGGSAPSPPASPGGPPAPQQ